jgi:hypothetical protein
MRDLSFSWRWSSSHDLAVVTPSGVAVGYRPFGDLSLVVFKPIKQLYWLYGVIGWQDGGCITWSCELTRSRCSCGSGTGLLARGSTFDVGPVTCMLGSAASCSVKHFTAMSTLLSSLRSTPSLFSFISFFLRVFSLRLWGSSSRTSHSAA